MKRSKPKSPNASAQRRRSTWNTSGQAEHRMLMAGWLAGFMAHEVNNHLAAALMELELALGQSHSPATNELLARLHVAVESAGEVCRSTLGLLRPASDNGQPGLVGDAIDRTMACLGRLRVRVVVDVSEECRLIATPLSLPRLQQVLLNSTLNALQASGEKVFISARLDQPAARSRSTWNTRASTLPSSALRVPAVRKIELAIEDSGPGMPAAVRSNLESGKVKRSPVTNGGGFGLSILQRLVVDAGGEIRVDPVAPHGTRLILALPSVVQAQSQAA